VEAAKAAASSGNPHFYLNLSTLQNTLKTTLNAVAGGFLDAKHAHNRS